MKLRTGALLFSAIVCTILLQTVSAWATPMAFDLVGVTDVNNRASVLFAYNAASGVVSLDITNTSLNYDPRITSFAFNAPSQVTGISSFTGPSGWNYAYAPNAIDTPMQLGFFDIAGLTGNNFNGGYPNNGIPLGQTFSFSFTLTGTGLDSLSETSFLSLFTDVNPYFVARFQRTGADGEGSDVAAPVPEPGTILLLGFGLSGFGILRRRGKK